MGFTHTSEFHVEFGDCDPAGIVFYPNYFRWMDAAARHFFAAAGVPAWRETVAGDGIFGTPLVDASARFRRPATYGETISVQSSIDEWRGRSFVLRHVIRRVEVELAEGREVRVFARRRPDDPSRIESVDIPAHFRARFG